MQDRFKVRVWDVKREDYIYDAQFEPDYDVIEDDTEYIPEQCTGLKDKNGELIYEGDIVNCSFNGKANTVETFSKKLFQGKHLVEFLEYYFSPFNYVNVSDVEVIGNIHETPELSEATND